MARNTSPVLLKAQSPSSMSQPATRPKRKYKKRAPPKNAFPKRLFQMLMDAERDGNQHIVSWVDDGTAFHVHDQEMFVSTVLPRYFRLSKYRSFQRQLNNYKIERYTSGPFRGAYHHFLLQRGQHELSSKLIREAIPEIEASRGVAEPTSPSPSRPIARAATPSMRRSSRKLSLSVPSLVPSMTMSSGTVETSPPNAHMPTHARSEIQTPAHDQTSLGRQRQNVPTVSDEENSIDDCSSSSSSTNSGSDGSAHCLSDDDEMYSGVSSPGAHVKADSGLMQHEHFLGKRFYPIETEERTFEQTLVSSDSMLQLDHQGVDLDMDLDVDLDVADASLDMKQPGILIVAL